MSVGDLAMEGGGRACMALNRQWAREAEKAKKEDEEKAKKEAEEGKKNETEEKSRCNDGGRAYNSLMNQRGGAAEMRKKAQGNFVFFL